jgi:hypothetical protein
MPDAAALLRALAVALTACEKGGIPVKLKHGAVITDHGYVLPLGDGLWAPRTLAYSPFSTTEAADSDREGS